MNKIIKCMEYLNYLKYDYHKEDIKITITLNGDCTMLDWEEGYDNVFTTKCKVNELGNHLQKQILEDLKKLVEAKMKNKILGFDLF